MTRDRIERLASLFRTLAQGVESVPRDLAKESSPVVKQFRETTAEIASELEDFLGEVPKSTVKPIEAMEFAPRTLEDLPAWIAGCSPKQVRGNWVALIIELAFDEEGVFRSSRTGLMRALAAVRDHKLANVIVDDPKAEVIASKPFPKESSVAANTVRKQLRAKLQATLPNAGDEAVLVDVFPLASSRAYISQLIHTWPEFKWETRQIPGRKGGPKRVVVRLPGLIPGELQSATPPQEPPDEQQGLDQEPADRGDGPARRP